MIGTRLHSQELKVEPVLYSYGTGEDLPLEVPTFQPSGDPIEVYRFNWGFYSTGESGMWVLSTEQLGNFLRLQSLGESLPLAALFQMLGIPATAPPLPSEKAATNDPLLERIRTRRLAIQQRRGILAESFPLIREDRER